MRSILALCALLFSAVALAAYSPTSRFDADARVLIASSTTGQVYEWPGGTGVFGVSGTFNGATVSLQVIMPDGSLLAAGQGTTCTAACLSLVYLPKCRFQATITSAGGSTSLSASLGAVQNRS